jgi:hypothetical protein
VRDRLEATAGFFAWDSDPYLVATSEGRLMWMADGYTMSNRHPYSRTYRLRTEGTVNYMRNAVKATVDAYDGSIRIYAFDEQDPILQAYRRLFPALILPSSAMPADLREHARYPEDLFRLQAEVYRTFHMRNPEAFFNKEDVWDLARGTLSPGQEPEPVKPTYVVASLPDQDEAEFMLLTTFTPRNKDNLIGLMLARCDGPHLGEIVVLQLSKQELVFGPMQVEARINQDQNISKDLTLWNQQGSQVLRGQMLVLPVEKTFLYIEPIYIQSSQARMPQLKKIAMALGERLVYTDTYELARQELLGGSRAVPGTVAAPAAGQPATGPALTLVPEELKSRIREALARYRTLMSRGAYGEAGRELENIEKLLEKK